MEQMQGQKCLVHGYKGRGLPRLFMKSVRNDMKDDEYTYF